MIYIKYRADIDGLRAVAVLAVIIYHINKHWLEGGFIGVDIFFVISGYLITKIIYTEINNHKFSFKEFYQRRISRILPVFFFVCFITFICAWYLLLPNEFILFFKSLKSTTYFGQNIFFANNTGGYWDQAAETLPLLHTWSLAVEEQFYFLVPLLILILTKLQASWRIVIAIFLFISLCSFSLAQFSHYSIFLSKYNYYSLFTGRAGELLLGSIVGVLSCYYQVRDYNKLNSCLSILALLAIIGSYIFVSAVFLFPSYWAIIPTAATGILIFFGTEANLVSRFLSLKPLVFIGKLSYSLYLWHWPIIVLTKKYLYVDTLNVHQVVFVIAATLICSIGTYYLIEKPFRKHKRNFASSLLLFYIFPTLIILGVYVANKKTDFLMPSEDKLHLYNLQLQYLNPSSNYCSETIINDCVIGDTTKSAPSFLFIGDSHAGAYFPYIDEAGKMYGFSAKAISASACSFVGGSWERITPPELDPMEAYCRRTMPIVRKEIDKFSTIIIAGRWDAGLTNKYYGKDLLNDLPKYIQDIQQKGKRVILFNQVPFLNKRYYMLWMRNYLNNIQIVDTDVFLNKADEANNIIELIAQQNNVLFFSPLNELNEVSKKEWPIYKGLIAYKDPDHLNEFVTRQWVKEVLPKQSAFWEMFIQKK